MKPPKKLWKLLELAMTDLAKAERSKKFKIDMGTWLSTNGTCKVCLAGSVMAFSLDGVEKCKAEGEALNERKYLSPVRFDDWQFALEACNQARMGDMYEAWDGMFDYKKNPSKKTYVALVAASFDGGKLYYSTYPKKRAAWKAQMRKSIRTLKEANV